MKIISNYTAASCNLPKMHESSHCNNLSFGNARLTKKVENVAQTSGLNAKAKNIYYRILEVVTGKTRAELMANALTKKTGIIQPGSTVLKKDLCRQKFGSYGSTYKFDPTGKSVEEVLAKNPHVTYDSTKKQYYTTDWFGDKHYIEPNKNYMIYDESRGGREGYIAFDTKEFAEMCPPKLYNRSGREDFFDKLKPGKISGDKLIEFKMMPAGTRYMSAEGPRTLQEHSVLMIDKNGFPYECTIEELSKYIPNFTLSNKKVFTEHAADYVRDILKTLKSDSDFVSVPSLRKVGFHPGIVSGRGEDGTRCCCMLLAPNGRYGEYGYVYNHRLPNLSDEDINSYVVTKEALEQWLKSL